MKPKRLFGITIAVILAVSAVAVSALILASPLRWKHELESDLRDVDEMRVGWDWQVDEVSGVVRGPLTELTLIRPDVASFLRAVDIDEVASIFSVACKDGPVFQFYSHGEQVCELSLQCDKFLRWTDGPWPGDAQLTQESEKALNSWLAERGYGGLQRE